MGTKLAPYVCACREAEVATEEAVAKGLSKLGYELAPGEMRSLARSVSNNKRGDVTRAAFVASQLDWHALQTDHKCVPLSTSHTSWGRVTKIIISNCNPVVQRRFWLRVQFQGGISSMSWKPSATVSNSDL